MHILPYLLFFHILLIYFEIIPIIIAISITSTTLLLIYELHTISLITKNLFNQNQQHIQEPEAKRKAKVLQGLVKRQIREFGLSLGYIGILGGGLGWGGKGQWSFLYLLPIIICTLWKSQRLFLVAYPTNSAEKPLMISPINTITELISLQCTCEIVVCFYFSIEAAFQIIYFIFMELLFSQKDLLTSYWPLIITLVKLSATMSTLITILLIKHRSSRPQYPGMYNSLLNLHLQIDKIIKYVHPEWRKYYHRRVYKTMRKLNKYEIVSTKISGGEGGVNWMKKMGFEGQIIEYYGSV